MSLSAVGLPGVGTLAVVSFGAYVHVPFCRHRCDYCSFATWTDRSHLEARYLDACRTQVARAGLTPSSVTSVFVGGGTPSLVDPDHLLSVIAQIPTAQRIIPAEIPEGTKQTDAVYDYEPDEGEILEALLPRNLTVQILRGLLENAASEQGARMSAMDSATRNAGEMIKKQTQLYNRSRQAMITKELIEIISGAEAL